MPIMFNLSGALDPVEDRRMQEAQQWIRDHIEGKGGIAICGVGRLAGGHRLVQAMQEREESPSSSAFSPLGPILDLVSELAGEELRQKNESSFGDLANRLFAICEPGSLSPEQCRLLDEINNRVVGISLADLARVPTVLLCAGGGTKYPAVRHVLRFQREESGRRVIRVLVTDSATAQRLVDDHADEDSLINTSELPGAR